MSGGKRGVETEQIDFSTVDMWAIRLVVHEGVKMNLSYEERLIAAWKMRQQGMNQREIAHRLRISMNECEAICQRARRFRRKLGLSDVRSTLHV